MNIRHITASVLVLSIAATLPAVPAAARGGEAIVGGIIGGIIGGAIANEAQKGRKQQQVVRAAPRAPDPARESRRDVQRSLNYFGFNAGSPDGVYGRNTRTAVSQYQATLGYPVTGELSSFQQDFLVQSWRRAEAGGATVLAQIAQNPGGAAGVLASWHAELAGGGSAPPMVVAGGPQPGGAAPFLPPRPQLAPVATGQAAPVAPPPAAPPVLALADPTPAAPSLPGFMSVAPVQASLTSHCGKVALVTNSNGGYVTLASMTDPAQALDEQFCLARTYAISDGEALAAGIKGVTPAELTAQCADFGPFMATPVALLSSQGPGQAIPAAAQLALGSGMGAAQLTATAKVCLSSGYRTDDMGVALGSALVLASLGELPYAELVGHHLLKGFGTGTNPALARDWFRLGVDAVAGGQPAAFAPGQPERVTLIRALVFGETPAPRPVAAGTPAANGSAPRLPGFSMNN